MPRIKTRIGRRSEGGVDKVQVRGEQPFDSGETLRPRGNFQCLVGARQVGLAAVPHIAFLKRLIGLLGDPALVPGRRVLVHVAVIIVQPEPPAERLDAAGALA